MPEKRTIYHKEFGPATMDAIDANRALVKHGEEWASEPWPAAKKDASPAKDAADHDDGKKADGKKG